jgi:CheY-like chemotaxis protein
MTSILVVDDLKDNHVLIKMGLRSEDVVLHHAYNGKEALEMLPKAAPDIILMDIQMPNMDGFEVTRQIKDIPKWKSVPVLFMSALKDIQNILKCYEAGGVDYISKPFKVPEVLARIRTHITIAKLQRELAVERDKMQSILNNMLPQHYIDQLKAGSTPKPELKSNVVIAFADFQNFTTMSQILGPEESVVHLNHLFFGFDEIASSFGLERVKTLGDGYFAIMNGYSEASENALATVAAMLKMIDYVNFYNKNQAKVEWKVRTGVHIGDVVTGIVGFQKIAFDVWGPSVNMASRLQSSSDAVSVSVSDEIFNLIAESITCSGTDTVELHRVGDVHVHRVDGLTTSNHPIIRTYMDLSTESIFKLYNPENSLINKLFQ